MAQGPPVCKSDFWTLVRELPSRLHESKGWLVPPVAAAVTLLNVAALVSTEASQHGQNGPQGAIVKGDLGKAKESGDRAAIEEAEKLLEERAEDAKRKTDESSRKATDDPGSR